MVNYQNGLIYKIVCNDLNIKQCYYGSTTNFDQRVKDHKKRCNSNSNIDKNRNCPKYKFIRENGGWQNWKMIIIQYFPCNSKRELERAERYEMEQDDNRLNVYLPSRTSEERKYRDQESNKKWRQNNKEILSEKNKKYRQDNKEILSEKYKDFYEKNKEQILEKGKKWYEKNKEKILENKKEYHENNKEKIKEKKKEYYENNKEKILENKKEYYENNKKEILERQLEKVTCDCGSIVAKHSLTRHKRSQKHLKLLDNK